MNMILISVLTVLLAIGQTLGGVCPDKAAIAPCTCDGYTVKCSINDDIELSPIFEAIRGPYLPGVNVFEVFELDSSVITSLDDVFNGVWFREIRINFAPNLDCIDPRAFQSMSTFMLRFNAEEASFKNYSKDCDIFGALSRLTYLQTIKIKGSLIEVIPDNAFSGKTGPQVDLVTIDLSGGTKGSIKKIGQHAFAGLKNLNSLDLSNNLINEIDQYAFAFTDQSYAVLKISLHHNQLNAASFKTSALAVNGRVTALDLSGNPHIRILDEDVFSQFLINSIYPKNTIDLTGSPLWVEIRNKWLVDDKSTLHLSEKLINALTDEGINILYELSKHFTAVPTSTTSTVPTDPYTGPSTTTK